MNTTPDEAADAPARIDLTSPSQADVRSRPGRLDIGVVGAGRVGAVLAAALVYAGHRVVAASAVSQASRERVELLLPGVPVAPVPDVVDRADLVLLTVPDDVLADLARGLAATGAWRAGQIVVHTSGRHGLAVLQPVTERGALPLALHPVMTFTGTSIDLARLSGCPFGVTAPPALLPVADALVLEMGGEPVHVRDDARPLYHAALAHAANHLMALVGSSADLLSAAGVAEPRMLLEPLLTAALDNALRRGDQALTGPVARGDADTVRAHVSAVAAVSEESAAAYRSLARLTAGRALAAGLLDPAGAAELLAVLAEGSSS